jgi:hypothetical protein
LDEAARLHGWNFHDLTAGARRSIFRLRGYGVANFFDLDPMHRDEVGAAARTLLFLRDPRDMITQMYLQGGWKLPFGSQGARVLADMPRPSFADFITSPRVAFVLERYRRFAEFRRGNPGVVTFRYEQALAGWTTIAADLVACLDLPLEAAEVMRIAAETPPISDRLPHQSPLSAGARRLLDPDISAADQDMLEREAAEAGLAFGFGEFRHVPRAAMAAAAPALVAEEQRAPDAVATPETPRPRNHLKAIFENDPQMMSRLRPNSSAVMHVLGRDVVMEVDASGCRPVTGQPETGEANLAFYGCSFTYGIAVATEETFASRLQGMLPTWRLENHGISGHGTSHNLLLLERLTRWNKPEYVVFCWIAHHRIRNVVDMKWVQTLNKIFPRSPAGQNNRRPMPKAALDERGLLTWRSTLMPRHDLPDVDLVDFYNDPFYQDLVSFRLFQTAAAHVRAYGGKFFVVSLQGGFSEIMRGWFAAADIPFLDASLDGPEWTCAPDDPHANARAHQIYAERIFAYLTSGSDGESDTPALPGDGAPPAWPVGPLA